jgi:hypothetical protein
MRWRRAARAVTPSDSEVASWGWRPDENLMLHKRPSGRRIDTPAQRASRSAAVPGGACIKNGSCSPSAMVRIAPIMDRRGHNADERMAP